MNSISPGQVKKQQSHMDASKTFLHLTVTCHCIELPAGADPDPHSDGVLYYLFMKRLWSPSDLASLANSAAHLQYEMINVILGGSDSLAGAHIHTGFFFQTRLHRLVQLILVFAVFRTQLREWCSREPYPSLSRQISHASGRRLSAPVYVGFMWLSQSFLPSL